MEADIWPSGDFLNKARDDVVVVALVQRIKNEVCASILLEKVVQQSQKFSPSRNRLAT
jgi:hypothetical protein